MVLNKQASVSHISMHVYISLYLSSTFMWSNDATYVVGAEVKHHSLTPAAKNLVDELNHDHVTEISDSGG